MKKDEQIKISVNTFNWGPCVVKVKITDEFKKLLLTEARKNKLDYTDKLAGILDKETGYSDESKTLIVPEISKYLVVAFDANTPASSFESPESVANLLT